MYEVYSKMLDGNDVRRISRIEWFDEFEEWHLIQSHYCLLVAAQGSFSSWFSEFTKNAQLHVCYSLLCTLSMTTCNKHAFQQFTKIAHLQASLLRLHSFNDDLQQTRDEVSKTAQPCSQLTTVRNHNIHLRLVVLSRLRLLDLVHNLHSLHNLSEHHVLAVQVRARRRRDKEL